MFFSTSSVHSQCPSFWSHRNNKYQTLEYLDLRHFVNRSSLLRVFPYRILIASSKTLLSKLRFASVLPPLSVFFSRFPSINSTSSSTYTTQHVTVTSLHTTTNASRNFLYSPKQRLRKLNARPPCPITAPALLFWPSSSSPFVSAQFTHCSGRTTTDTRE